MCERVPPHCFGGDFFSCWAKQIGSLLPLTPSLSFFFVCEASFSICPPLFLDASATSWNKIPSFTGLFDCPFAIKADSFFLWLDKDWTPFPAGVWLFPPPPLPLLRSPFLRPWMRIEKFFLLPDSLSGGLPLHSSQRVPPRRSTGPVCCR